jgi:type IV pilus assembly protein PilA
MEDIGMKRFMKQIGQGMTEYIIIVALIAIAAIAVYTGFGDVVRGQVGGMAEELSGTQRTTAGNITTGAATATTGAANKDLSNYAE